MSSNYLFISILKLVVSATVQKPKLLTFLHLRMISLYIDSGKKYYGTYMKLCRSHRAHRNACSWECKYIPCTNLDLCRTEIGPMCNASVGHTSSSRHPPRSHTYNLCWWDEKDDYMSRRQAFLNHSKVAERPPKGPLKGNTVGQINQKPRCKY